MSDETTLLPCPFCSAEPEMWSDSRRTWGLVQHKDGCLFPNIREHEIPEEDFAAWNVRAELGSERELIDLAHNAWSMALCAMQGMPIPAEWGNAVEHGLRKYGINVDEELTGFEVIDE